MTDIYRARVVEVPDQGVRLQPDPGSTIPDQPTEVNLLALAVAMALGASDYEHHPEPRTAGIQTLDALLAGDACMPWRPGPAQSGDARDSYLVCERHASSAWKCHIEATA